MRVKTPWDHLYSLAAWRGPNGVRLAKLRRDPICQVLGCNRPATCVDHIKKHRGDMDLFLGGDNMVNLRSLCQKHHDEKDDAHEDGREDFNPVSATGEQGRQYCSSTVSARTLDDALGSAEEIAELLKGVVPASE